MIRIVHLITGLNVGGAEMMLYKLLSTTDRLAFEPYVISMKPLGPIAKKIQALHIPIYSLNMSNGLPLKGTLELFSLLRQIQPQILQTWMYHADLLGSLMSKITKVDKLVWNIQHSNLSKEHSKLRTRAIVQILSKLSHNLPNRIVSCSHIGAKVHTAIGYASKISVIPNGIDLDAFKPDKNDRLKTRQELMIPENEFVIGIVARFDPQKDFENFIKAARLLQRKTGSVSFILCGRGITEQNKQLMTWIDEYRLRKQNIRLLGPRSDIPKILNAMDLFSLASAYGEGSPNVVGEAMACGIPCVVTDVGDSAYIVEQTGLTVKPQDPIALSEAWHKVLQLDVEERRFLGSQARARIQNHFSLDIITPQYETLYRELVSFPVS